MALWLAWQLTALGIAAFRIPLSARYPAAGEQLALPLMLVAQISGAALFFPSILRTAPATLIAIALAWPICELASFLADADLHKFAMAELYVSAWLIVLYIWLRYTADFISPAYLSSLIALITFGGPLIAYLRAEFVPNSASPSPALLSPIVGVLSLIEADSPRTNPWWVLLALAIAVPIISMIAIRLRPAPNK